MRLRAAATRGRACALALGLLVASGLPAAAAPKTDPTDAGAAAGEQIWASCVERVPEGARRPELEVSFPARGLSGHEARLRVVVTHGAGETVLPEGFRLQRSHEAARAIEQAGFAIAEPDGGSSPTLERQAGKTETKTTLTIPFVPLADEPGRQHMVLPPLPITVARASGEVMTLCTPPQAIAVEEPIANETDPEVKPNPPPRPQRDKWELAQWLFFAALGSIVVGVLLALLIRHWLGRPKVVPPKPKPLPWIAALAELEAIRRSSLLDEGHLDELFDRVDDCIRNYLGERYGFDGLESTTAEMHAMLGRVYPTPPELDRIQRFLDDTHLVKFADVHPSREDCTDAMSRAERIIRSTTPTARPATGPAAQPPRRAA